MNYSKSFIKSLISKLNNLGDIKEFNTLLFTFLLSLLLILNLVFEYNN